MAKPSIVRLLVIALCSAWSSQWIGSETAMAEPSTVRLYVQVEHVRIEAAKPFEAVKAALESLVPPLDPAIPQALRQPDRAELDPDLCRYRCPRCAIARGQDRVRGGALAEAALRNGMA